NIICHIVQRRHEESSANLLSSKYFAQISRVFMGQRHLSQRQSAGVCLLNEVVHLRPRAVVKHEIDAGSAHCREKSGLRRQEGIIPDRRHRNGQSGLNRPFRPWEGDTNGLGRFGTLTVYRPYTEAFVLRWSAYILGGEECGRHWIQGPIE